MYSPSSYTFLAGNVNQSCLQKVIPALKSLSNAKLICPPGCGYLSFFEEEGFTLEERIQFRRPPDLSTLDNWKRQLPAQYLLDRISSKNFYKCHWLSFIQSFYGGSDLFFANGAGFCLSDQGKILSESYGLIADGMAEIGVVTDESYRGQNLGTIVCAVMLEDCYQHNLEPFWNCKASNSASASVARKLAFEEECRYFGLLVPGR